MTFGAIALNSGLKGMQGLHGDFISQIERSDSEVVGGVKKGYVAYLEKEVVRQRVMSE